MEKNNINRRLFIKSTALASAAITLTGKNAFSAQTSPAKNKLPRWKGFNLLDYFSPSIPANPGSTRTTENDLKWMRDWGFDFVRIPIAYPRYLSFDHSREITKEEVYKTDEKVLNDIDQLILMANNHGLNVSLTLHRAPGYCINAGFHEPFNLWKDKDAQAAFNFHWLRLRSGQEP